MLSFLSDGLSHRRLSLNIPRTKNYSANLTHGPQYGHCGRVTVFCSLQRIRPADLCFESLVLSLRIVHSTRRRSLSCSTTAAYTQLVTTTTNCCQWPEHSGSIVSMPNSNSPPLHTTGCVHIY